MGLLVIFICLLAIIALGIYDNNSDMNPIVFLIIAVSIVLILGIDVAFLC